MWYHWGLGVGHSYSHGQDRENLPPRLLFDHEGAQPLEEKGSEEPSPSLFQPGQSELGDQEAYGESGDNVIEDSEEENSQGDESEGKDSDSEDDFEGNDSQGESSEGIDDEYLELQDTYGVV